MVFFIPCSVVGELIHYQSNTKELEDKNENTPLHLACMNGHLEVARMLLAPHLLLEKYGYVIHTSRLHSKTLQDNPLINCSTTKLYLCVGDKILIFPAEMNKEILLFTWLA